MFELVVCVLLALIVLSVLAQALQSVIFSFTDYRDHKRPWSRDEKIAVAVIIGPGLLWIACALVWEVALKPFLA